MGWFSSLTDFIGITDTGAAREEQARADQAQARAEAARRKAEAEAIRLQQQKDIQSKNMQEIAAQASTDVNSAALSNVVAGGTAGEASDLIKKKNKGLIPPALSTSLGINI